MTFSVCSEADHNISDRLVLTQLSSLASSAIFAYIQLGQKIHD